MIAVHLYRHRTCRENTGRAWIARISNSFLDNTRNHGKTNEDVEIVLRSIVACCVKTAWRQP
jgi:hypothetical protein